MIGDRVTVGTSATEIVPGGRDESYATSCIIRVPVGGAAIDLGGSDVVTGEGFELGAGEAVSIDPGGQSVYGVKASGSQVVHVLYRVGSD